MRYRLMFWRNVSRIHQAPRVSMGTPTRSGEREKEGVRPDDPRHIGVSEGD
jgi:hypothetical protein